MMTNKIHVIGVFDSGIGGLTVVKQLIKIIPNVKIFYFGDLANIPYGNKSTTSIRQFSKNAAIFLKEHINYHTSYFLDAVIIACNTISALASDLVRDILTPIPVIDIITPICKYVVTKFTNIGIIGTRATIMSDTHKKIILQLNADCKVYGVACPLFVPFIEENLPHHLSLYLIAEEYLKFFKNKQLDCLILGCTHYPIINNLIDNITKLSSLDPAISAVEELKNILSINHIAIATDINNHNPEFFVTDLPEKFQSLAEMFLGFRIKKPILLP